MNWKTSIFVGILAFGLFSGYQLWKPKSPKLIIPKTGYYGSGESKADDKSINSFVINVSDSQLQDLKTRLKNTRITHDDLEDMNDFTYGFTRRSLDVFLNYWLNEYDWRKEEKLLNSLPHYKTQIEGLSIHFIHAKPPSNKYQQVIPLLISHGWPGSTHEFNKIIPLLIDPIAHKINTEFAFEVVAPSIPGFGWSEAAHKKGLNQAATARIFHELACRLGFKKYIAQGGDWGAVITSQIARLYPDRLFGLHLNMMSLPYTSPSYVIRAILGSFFPTLMFQSPEFHDFSFRRMMSNYLQESGYYHIQATKPNTVGVALNDSPLGLLAYILEKVSAATNVENAKLTDGGLEGTTFNKDELITMVMIYWLNGNMLQATRFYKEAFEDHANRMLMREYVNVATGYAALQHDAIPPQPLELARLTYNITHYTFLKDCGHFGAMQKPRELAIDIFEFARLVT